MVVKTKKMTEKATKKCRKFFPSFFLRMLDLNLLKLAFIFLTQDIADIAEGGKIVVEVAVTEFLPHLRHVNFNNGQCGI